MIRKTHASRSPFYYDAGLSYATTAPGLPVVPFLRRSTASLWCLVCVSALPGSRGVGHDWPQFLGPTRDGVYRGKIATSWGKQAPKTLWRKAVGAGFRR
jgi:hypothetical protein